jgi:hypothetical protein
LELLKTGIPLFLNLAVMASSGITLCRLRRKKDILKYYTYLSNLIALLGSTVFVAVSLWNLISGNYTPIWLKGVRFTSTYMLVTTLFVFSLVLLPSHKSGNTITAADFIGISPKLANLILHYLCPAISAISFILLERQPILAGSQWTLYAALPTIAYWTVYLILTATNLWKDPYGFSNFNKNNGPAISPLAGAAMFLLIPAMSMGLDYLLWWINTLNF